MSKTATMNWMNAVGFKPKSLRSDLERARTRALKSARKKRDLASKRLASLRKRAPKAWATFSGVLCDAWTDVRKGARKAAGQLR